MIIDILLVIIILQIGLTSGLLFIFAFAVNPGLARLSEEEYFRAMKYINIVILNPIFFLVFMGPLITMPLLTYLSWNDSYPYSNFYNFIFIRCFINYSH